MNSASSGRSGDGRAGGERGGGGEVEGSRLGVDGGLLEEMVLLLRDCGSGSKGCSSSSSSSENDIALRGGVVLRRLEGGG